MISLDHLQNKLNKQASAFSLLLELPIPYAENLWANGIFSFATFSEAHADLSNTFNESNLETILQHDTLKYLMINEYDDQTIIESLHSEIEAMALWVANQSLVDSEVLELVSTIYKVLGLPDAARFIVNTGADFKLEWRPYFDALIDPLTIQYTDLKVHERYYRLIATKYPFEKITLNNIKEYIARIIMDNDGEYEGCISSGNSLSKHEHWLVMTLESFTEGCSNDDRLSLNTFEIEGVRYLIFGFPITTSLAFDWRKPELNLQIKNIDGDQKFIIRIDQQALIFYARRLDDSTINTIDCDELIASFNLGVLSHFDADDQLHSVNQIKYLTCFRPYSLEDMNGELV